MAGEDAPPNEAQAVDVPLTAEPALVKIVPEIPVIFADTAASHSYGPGIAKFYLMRFDSDPWGRPESKMTPVAQVIMPAEGFLGLFTFFEQRLKTMVAQGILTQAQVEASREFWAEDSGE